MGIAIPPSVISATADLGPLCHVCITLISSKEEQGKELNINCTRCAKPFCEKHSSKVDPQFCQDCCKDFEVIERHQLYTGVEEIRIIDPNGQRPETIAKIPYRTRYKQITLRGTDWMFMEIWLQNLSEDQAEVALQWHKAVVSDIEQVLTEHKIRKAHKLAQVRVPKVVTIKKESIVDDGKKQAKLAATLANFIKVYGAAEMDKVMAILKQTGAAK